MAIRIIFDNIIFSLQQVGGISAFWSELISGINKQDEFDCYYVEYPNAEDNIFRSNIHIDDSKIINGRSLPFGIERILEPYIPPALISKPFIFHSSYYRIFSHNNCHNISTVHDLIHEHKAAGNWLNRGIMCKVRKRVLSGSDRIVCVSEYTRHDLERMYSQCVKSKVAVAYNAPVNCYNDNIIGTYGTRDYLLYVGARDKYKNFEFALKLTDAFGLKLKVVGAPLTNIEKKTISRKYKNAIIENEIYPTTQRMSELYKGAICLLYLSEYEGFGIPIVEAQASGCPVIGLNRTAVPEIGGKGILTLNRLLLNEALNMIDRLKDIEFRQAIVSKGLINSQRFSWQSTIDCYSKIYKECMEISD